MELPLIGDRVMLSTPLGTPLKLRKILTLDSPPAKAEAEEVLLPSVLLIELSDADIAVPLF